MPKEVSWEEPHPIPWEDQWEGASPGAVRALTDKQCIPQAADGAVALVPIIVIQEEALQELVLGQSKGSCVCPPAPRPTEAPPPPSLLTLHGAHIPPSNRGCCVCTWKLPQQRQMSKENTQSPECFASRSKRPGRS
jgi:hypothetical protein